MEEPPFFRERDDLSVRQEHFLKGIDRLVGRKPIAASLKPDQNDEIRLQPLRRKDGSKLYVCENVRRIVPGSRQLLTHLLQFIRQSRRVGRDNVSQ